MRSVAVFGGTFDPVHQGHILTSNAIQSFFHFDSYYFLPCNIPVLKSPAHALKQQRIEMLQLAIKPYAFFDLDLREINRNTPSYMVDTLKSFRADYNDASLTLVMGYDAFLSLPQWHQWEQLISLANLLVIERPMVLDTHLDKKLTCFFNEHQTVRKEDLLQNKCGFIYLFNAGNYAVSSTEIRRTLKENKGAIGNLSKEVHEYIQLNNLY